MSEIDVHLEDHLEKFTKGLNEVFDTADAKLCAVAGIRSVTRQESDSISTARLLKASWGLTGPRNEHGSYADADVDETVIMLQSMLGD